MSEFTGNITKYFNKLVFSNKVLFVLYLLIPLLATIQQILLGTQFEHYTFYNNYLIFEDSFKHLIENKDLYQYYPDEYMDLYKYTPTFAALMCPFYLLHDYVGLFLWNLINCIFIYWAFIKFPSFSKRAKILSLWFVAHELLTATQNSQSNGLIVGLILLAYIQFENGKLVWSSLFLALGFFVKPFVLVAYVLFLFYEKKLKFITWTFIWGIILTALPLLFVSFQQLIFLYKSWINCLNMDHSTSYGISAMGMLNVYFGMNAKGVVLAIGIILFLVPLVRIKMYGDDIFRKLFLAFVLLWVIVFNHKSESPTFIIAVCGVAIWYFSQPKNYFNLFLLLFCLVLTQLSASDFIFTSYVKEHVILYYKLKVLPCLIILLALFLQLMTLKRKEIF